MYLEAVKNDVTRVNTGAESKFTFAMNATAVQVLNNALYQDKPGSIVRELSCNALDSHIMAGCPDRPFSIHIPTNFEPYLSIRDYGIGLDDDGVRNVFSAYFNSTKSKSNDCIGAFGLGSKTPFSYSDQFTITAIKDGVKRIYSAFISEDGIPSVALMGDEVRTSESNGVEVMVPVTDSDDFSKFTTAIAQQLRFFKVKPTLLNGTVEFDAFDLINLTDSLSLIKNGGNRAKFWVVQGGVGYPVDVSTLRQSTEEESRALLDYLATTGAVLTFPIGAIETTASREGLSYTKKTFASINALLASVRDIVADRLYDEIAAMPSQWERAKYLNDHQTHVRIIENKNANFKALVPDLDPVNHSQLNFSWGLDLAPAVGLIQKYKASKGYRRNSKYKVSMTSTNAHIKAETYVPAIILRDTDDKPQVRLNNYLLNNASMREAFVIVPNETAPGDVLALLEKIGLTYTLLSTLPIPARAPRVATGSKDYTKPSCYIRSKGQSYTNAKDWDRVIPKLAEIPDGGYYVVIPEGSRFDVTPLPASLRFVWSMVDADALDKDVYAIRARELKRIANNPDWIPLAEVASERLADAMRLTRLVRSMAAAEAKNIKSARTIVTVVDAVLAKMEADGARLPKPMVALQRYRALVDRLAAEAHAADEWDLHILKEQDNGSLAQTVERFGTLRNNIVSNIIKAFPLLNGTPTVRGNWNSAIDDHEYSVSDEMLAHVCDYVAIFA